MSRCPTARQVARLLARADGSVAFEPRRAQWMPLLRNGWVEKVGGGPVPRGGLLPPLRITPAGFRALGDGLERHGWPSCGRAIIPRGSDPLPGVHHGEEVREREAPRQVFTGQ